MSNRVRPESRLDPLVYENVTYGGMPTDLSKLTISGLLMRLDRLTLSGSQNIPF